MLRGGFTFSCTDVVDPYMPGFCFLQGFDMSIYQISDINIIPYARPVLSLVIRSTNLDLEGIRFLNININAKLKGTWINAFDEVESSREEQTLRPGMIPRAASKQAPDIRPCSRSSGRGASPSLPSGSEPMTLKYLIIDKISHRE